MTSIAEKTKITPYGHIAFDFFVSRLEEICIPRIGVQTGPFGSLLHKKDYVESGTPIITVEHLGENRIIHENTPFVSHKDRIRLEKYSLKLGDIVFSRVGSVDRRSLVRKTEAGWLFSGRCLRVRANQEIVDPIYLSYFFGLNSFKEYIQSIAVGATMPSLNTRILSEIPIYYPPLPEQRAIAHILGTLDDKIELNRRMNATLEAMTRAIFKSWFVDFDPVQAKMEGEEPAGMDAETAALFPKILMGFKEKLVPEGWELKTLGTFIELDKGLSYKGKFLVDGFGTPMVNLGTVAPYYGFLHDGLKHYSGEFKERHTVKPGSIIIANTDMTQNRVVLGSPAIVPDLKSKVIIFTHHIFAVRNNSSLPNTFIYYLLQNDEYRNRVKGFATGTTVLALPKEAVLDYEFSMPPKELVDGFCQIAYLVHKKIEQNNEESNTLAALRDTLLPKLISGEIRVPVTTEQSEERVVV